MPKVRNLDARCWNCPYYHSLIHPVGIGMCHRMPSAETKIAAEWCGEHPDFLIDAPEPLDKPE